MASSVRLIGFGVGVAMLMTAAAAHATTQKSVVPPGAVPVPPRELKQIYDNKTWQWQVGGGRFSEANRSFVAWSSTDGVDTYGTGHWELTNSGKLCMVATWKTKETSGKNRTCFRHLKVGDTIYQKREPKGKWYVFKSGNPWSKDEYSKLIDEDTVSVQALRIQTRIAAK